MLLAEKSTEIFPEHNGYFFVFRNFHFELIYFCSIKKQKTAAPIIIQT